jgi:hypothetical protein
VRDRDEGSLGLGMPDNIGEALLHTAVEGQIDRLAIGGEQIGARKRDGELWVLAGAFSHERGQQLGDRDLTERHRPQAIQDAPIDGLKSLDHREHLACTGLERRSRQAVPERRRVRLKSEQIGPDLVVEVERRLPAFVVLCADQTLAQTAVLRPHRVEDALQRIEALGNDSQLMGLWPRQAHGVIAPPKVEETGGERPQRRKHAAEEQMQDRNAADPNQQRDLGKARRIVPDLGDLVARRAR